MAKDYVSQSVDCPFYHSEKDQLLKCEGPIIGTSIHLVMGNKADKHQYKKLYCRGNFKRCLLYRMLAVFKHGEENDE